MSLIQKPILIPADTTLKRAAAGLRGLPAGPGPGGELPRLRPAAARPHHALLRQSHGQTLGARRPPIRHRLAPVAVALGQIGVHDHGAVRVVPPALVAWHAIGLQILVLRARPGGVAEPEQRALPDALEEAVPIP